MTGRDAASSPLVSASSQGSAAVVIVVQDCQASSSDGVQAGAPLAKRSLTSGRSMRPWPRNSQLRCSCQAR